MPYTSVKDSQKKASKDNTKKNMYVYLDEVVPAGKMLPTMYANLSTVVRSDLWHPQEDQDKVEKIMNGKDYSGNMILVGHGSRGAALVNMNGKESRYNGEKLVNLLKDTVPKIYRNQTTNIFALQCNASLPKMKKTINAADGVVTKEAIAGSSLTDSLAQSIASNKDEWPNMQAVHGNKWITVYQASKLFLNAANIHKLDNAVSIGFGEVDKLTNPSNYKANKKIE